MTYQIPFVDLQAQRERLGDGLTASIDRVLEHGQFIMGPEVAELEAALSAFTGVEEVVTCSSGTDALLLPLLASGVGPGDAVIVPTFTFPATPEVVALLGAVPVFADVDAETFNLRPDDLELGLAAARKAGLRPVAAIVVDLFGQPADHADLAAVAEEEGIWILADAAQSLGASYRDVPVANHGRCTAASFFPAKPLGCYGDGGALLTNDPELADRCRSLRVHGQGRDKYDVARVGLNARLDTLQAAVLLEKLRIFEDELERRSQVASRYTAGLDDVVAVPVLSPDRTSAWAQYTIRVERRDGVASALSSAGIPSAIYYPRPLHRSEAYAGAPRAEAGLSVAERLCERVLSLPMHPYLDPTTQDRVIDTLRVSLR